jgi:hypothetical protein
MAKVKKTSPAPKAEEKQAPKATAKAKVIVPGIMIGGDDPHAVDILMRAAGIAHAKNDLVAANNYTKVLDQVRSYQRNKAGK